MYSLLLADFPVGKSAVLNCGLILFINLIFPVTKPYMNRYSTFEKTLRKGKIIGIHTLTFVILTIALFLSAESLLNKFASGIHNVGMWLNLIIYGTVGILNLTIISCLIFLKKMKTEH